VTLILSVGDIAIPTASVSCIEYAADGPTGGKVVVVTELQSCRVTKLLTKLHRKSW